MDELVYFDKRRFENDGVQEILDFIFILSLVGTKATFFSNFPRHRAIRNAEYQVLPASSIKTGWDIMRWKGPVGPEEERQLREKPDAPWTLEGSGGELDQSRASSVGYSLAKLEIADLAEGVDTGFDQGAQVRLMYAVSTALSSIRCPVHLKSGR